jgi:hypothetical protein
MMQRTLVTTPAARPRLAPQAEAAPPVPLNAAAMNGRRVDCPAAMRPLLFVVVDTEETFDWGAPFARTNVDVRAMREIGRLQSSFAAYGVRPTYVVDYPVATQPDGIEPLKELLDAGQCDVGAHLHPWVNPPFVEPVSRRTSFGCNLGADLEAAKIRALTAAIEEHFERTPVVFKAGRYGFGASTAGILEDQGFWVDNSVNPTMDFSAEAGPSFREFDASPFWFGRRRRLLEVPCSMGYTGLASGVGDALHTFADRPALRPARLVGLMARLRVLNKVMLSPEGFTLDEMKALAAALHARGVRTFALTMHSPSVQPGCTPYVRSRADLEAFLARIRGFCEFFFGELQGTTMLLREFYERRRLDESPVTQGAEG